MGDLKNAVIEIDKVEDSERKVSITAKSKLKFSIWKTKKDGSMSKAFAHFKDVPDLYANNWSVAYGETAGDINGQPITYRNIVGFEATADQPYMPQDGQGDGGTSSNLARAGMSKDGYGSDDIFGKCKSLLMASAFGVWIGGQQEMTPEIVEQQAEKWAPMMMRNLSGTKTPESAVNAPTGVSEPPTVSQETPTTQNVDNMDDDDIKVENIPF